MTRPFISVVIPTKNRSFLVESAIQSVLRQSFEDFEIVVADNDDTDATRLVIESFHDSRIHYHCTGGLSMPDNWEFATSKAEGEYIAILEDKQVLKKHALEKVFELSEADRPPVVGWLYDRFYDTQDPPKVMKTEGTGKHEVIPSGQIIETFINLGRFGECDRLLPRGLNSCFHSTLAKRIRDGSVGRLCTYTAPDYTLAFQQLAYCDEVLHIDEALVIVGGYRYSTGRNSKENMDSSLKYYQEADWDRTICYNRVPIKAITISGSLYNDYENIRLSVGGNLSAYPLNMHNYFIQCFNDIQISKRKNVQMLTEEIEWRRAISEQDPSIQNVVYRKLLTDQTAFNEKLSAQLSELVVSRDNWKKNFRELESRMTAVDRFILSHWSRSVMKLLQMGDPSKKRKVNAVSPQDELPETFSNALEYIMWEENHQDDVDVLQQEKNTNVT